MRLKDVLVLVFVLALVWGFATPSFRVSYEHAFQRAPILLSFIKFAILATFGEMLVLRIKQGVYWTRRFGLFPKMVVWGLLGIAIYWAFVIFSKGVPALMPSLGEPGSFGARLVQAAGISVFMNVVFAPPMMLTHHLTDRFIDAYNGSFPIMKLRVLPLLKGIDWDKMWSFVFVKTIPLFWIPAHTVTFMLPTAYRTLFAAVLSVLLGLILAFAKHRSPAVKSS